MPASALPKPLNARRAGCDVVVDDDTTVDDDASRPPHVQRLHRNRSIAHDADAAIAAITATITAAAVACNGVKRSGGVCLHV
jgi:hypothetical protein